MTKKESKKSKVLVTGATGFVGSYLCDALLKKDYQVIGLSHTTHNRLAYIQNHKNFSLVKGDITNFKNITNILTKHRPAATFHTAALLHSPEPNDGPFPFFATNAKGTLNILEACRLRNIKTIIYSSSMSVYGAKYKYLPVDEKHPTAPYDFYSTTKLMGEELCQLYAEQYQLNVIILRYAGIYGTRRKWGALYHFVKNTTQNQSIKILNNICWDIIHVKDVVQANVSAFAKAEKIKYKIINIGSGQEVNIKTLAKKIVKISGSRSKIIIPKNLSKSPSSHFYFDLTTAKKLLNFNPSALESGLLNYIKTFKQER
jgi:UDP-glucose 4-epimerase